MLATTQIADEVLHALDEASEPACQDAMLQKCRIFKNKLMIYCAGLVEVGPEKQWKREDMDDRSWYGQMYDSVFSIAHDSTLRFIHRTASDFLTDTAPGGKILGFDTSSDFDIDCRLMNGSLARLTLFAADASGGQWVENLDWIRRRWMDTDEWKSDDWERLVSNCEKLANCGRLFAVEYYEAQRIGPDFSRYLAYHDCADEIIISRLNNGNLSDNEKSGTLLSLSGSYSSFLEIHCERSLVTRCRAFRELLMSGADPNRQSWDTICSWKYRTEFLAYAHITLQTPWQLYLYVVMAYTFGRGSETTRAVATSMTQILSLFVSRGARLDDSLNIVIDGSSHPKDDYCIPVSVIDWESGQLLASVPTNIYVKILIEVLRQSLKSEEWSLLEDSCQFLDRRCMNRRSSNMCRIFGKIKGFEYFRDPKSQPMLLETIDEEQTQLGSRFMQHVKRQTMLSIKIVIGENSPIVRDSESMETFQSISDDESWTVKAVGKSAICERLEELGFITRIDGVVEKRYFKEWVRMHNDKLTNSDAHAI